METDVLHLKSNVLPRGLFPLEDLFDFNDVAKKMKNRSQWTSRRL
jgi:hypothetical protein